MRVVLDTNVLIAAFIARGVCADLLEHCALNHTILLSEPILDELRQHLVGKFKQREPDADDAIALLRSRVELIAPQPLTSAVCRDPDDDVILATAESGAADCIVTGDKDLLVLQRFKATEIVSPGKFAEFEASRPA